MDVLAHTTPKLPETDAIGIAGQLYGLTVSARSLPGEYDDNFLLTSADGRRFTLKVMRAGCEPGLIDLQIQTLAWLAERAPSLRFPRVSRTVADELVGKAKTSDGTERLVWMLSYIPGRMLADINPHTPALLFSLGRFLGELDAALEDFFHPGAQRELKWDLARADWILGYLDHIQDLSQRKLVERLMHLYRTEVSPAFPGLPTSVIHNDANDYNVIVEGTKAEPPAVATVVDFGDMLQTATVCEIAVAAAYASLGKQNPLAAAAQVVAGYHSTHPLDETEIVLLYPMICARLCVSVTNSAYRKTIAPDDPYVTVSERPAWDALDRLASIHPRFAHYTFRQACGLTPVPASAPILDWLRNEAPDFSPVLDLDLRKEPCHVFDLSVGSLLLGADPRACETEVLTRNLFERMRQAGAKVGVGRYDEARLLYTSPAYATGQHPTDERRTIHLGIDLFAEPGSPVYAPLEGSVRCIANNATPKDYGPLIILRHTTEDGHEFDTLYGHLSEDSLAGLKPGETVSRGQQIARIGAPPVNGDWAPHLHFQLILDLLELDRDFPGVAYASQRGVWGSLSPDPNVILGIPADRFPPSEPTKEATLAARRAWIGSSLSLTYREPLKIVRGWMQYLYDETGRAYVDAYNNVPHVGHSHPRVVRAGQEQAALLNTNTRYLHDNIALYAERLCTTLPNPLEVCFFVNSASEANELALRLARTYTGMEDVIVLEGAYHGHTTTLVDISPYKFNGPGGAGAQPWVHVAPLPDDFRGPYKREDPAAGKKYGQQVAAIVDQLQAEGKGLAVFMCESLPSVAGQIVFPPGYLTEAFRAVRRAGAVCIADEVQVGFGRLGAHFWGFETQGVVPDIVVVGKPIGNGHPLGAVITTREIAGAFDTGMEFFSTFGGNPVSCAVGLAVLDVLQEEHLQEHALEVGDRLLAGLREIKEKHSIVGDVRGLGLFIGVELVRDLSTLEPASEQTDYVVNRLKERGILTGTEGLHGNVIKIRPPLPFSKADAALLLHVLDEVLQEDRARLTGNGGIFVLGAGKKQGHPVGRP